ncbi:MAG: hypothetical protein C0404_05755 [Verrucomicrobia bacterium]|nr:hypothetical protein [Verrucomicrobiota bacterium]
MKQMKLRFFAAWLLACWLAAGAGAADTNTAPARESVFMKDVEALTANRNRLAGREDGSRAASAYVEKRLQEIGIKEIFIQEFPVVLSRNTECFLVADGVTNEISACRPNLLQASITPEKGLTGETLYVGEGEVPDYGTNSTVGRIVVLDTDSRKNWLTAFALGATAVIFVEDAGKPVSVQMHVNLPANLPRFYVTAAQAEKLELKTRARTVTIKSACVWEDLRGRNVIGLIRGSGAAVVEGSPRETILLSAPLDSYSEVPELSAGARDAANCAVLLSLAGHLQKNQPKRDIIVAFFDGQWQNHLGARAFYGALYRRLGSRNLADMSLPQRLESFGKEAEYILKVQKVLAEPDLFAKSAMEQEGFGDSLRLIRGVVAGMGAKAMTELVPLRVRERDLKALEQKDDAEGKEELARLRDDASRLGLISTAEVDDLAWNSILRVVNEKTSINDSNVVERLTMRMISDPDAKRQAMKRDLFRAKLRENLIAAVAMTQANCQSRLKELEYRRTETEQATAITNAFGQARSAIVLNMAVNLGDRGSAWSVVHGDNSMGAAANDEEGLYKQVFTVIRQTHEELKDELVDFDVRPVSELYPSKLFAPGRHVDAGGVARMFGKFNLAFMTVNDPLERQGAPTDRLALLDTTGFEAKARQIGALVKRLADQRTLGKEFPQHCQVWFNEARWTGIKNHGCVIKQLDVGDRLRTAAVPNALFAVVNPASGKMWDGASVDSSAPGMLWEIVGRAQSDGIYELPPLPRDRAWPAFVVVLDPRGLIKATTVGAPPATASILPVNIANVRGISLVGYGFSRGVPTIPMRASSTTRFRDDRHMLCENENILVLFAPYDAKAAKLFNPGGMVLLENRPVEKEYQGIGFELFDAYQHLPTSAKTAKDMHSLNAYRLNLLRDNRIGEESLERLHGRAGDIATDAVAAGVESVDQRQGMLEASAAFSRRMYSPLVSVMNDLVTAVVFLLLLTIPFAFAMERLLIGTPHIYSRIGWFAVFFLLTFGVLYTVNPAFKLAATPIIIFLAFTIILLSTLVMFIMVRKLETEMKKLQGRSASAHSVDVSRISTMSAAIGMGISTMRRRPLRTLLTSVTVVLLTFTILTFASFSSIWGNRKSYVGPMSDAPARILVRHQLWNAISEDLYGTLRGFMTGKAEVVPLYWLAPLAQEVTSAIANRDNLSMMLASGDGVDVTQVSAAIGFDGRDVEKQPRLQECFAADAKMELLKGNGIFLTKAVSSSLKLTSQDVGSKTIIFRGRKFVYGGNMEDRFGFHPLLEGSSMLPVDYKSSIAGGDAESLKKLEQTQQESDSTSFISFNADAVVVISSEQARRLGARIRAISVYPKDVEEIENIGQDIATISALPTYTGTKGGVYRVFFSKLIEASGFKDLLIPVILGGLIVFATMLGSVADREGEIYAFSSLGLAPAHVSMLFFAEAAIYAVVGGMGGYLLGQVAASLLSYLSAYWHFAVPSMNFSSMNAIATIFIVMAIVLLSTVYPAVKAARSANPGIQRAWRLPQASGDTFDINFPFTVSEYDLTGVVSYLEEHFKSFADTSIGVFATTDCNVLKQKENNMLGFRARVALAPFDLGIEQSVVILSQPSDIEGIDEVRVLIRRLSGTYGDWQRANRVFINDLRRQFLVWRTLDKEVARHYRETTLQAWETLPLESTDDVLKDFGAKAAQAKS